MTASSPREERLSSEQLRRAFDAAFALPALAPAADFEDLLLIRERGDDYAVRGRELSGVFAMPKLTRLPSPTPGLLGLVALRGVLVPVFGLSRLLGYEPSGEPLRWLALVGAVGPIALAFHAIVDFKRLPRSAFSTTAAPTSHAGQRATVDVGGQLRVVIELNGLVSGIRERSGRSRPEKEA